jgi:hypothetical protein
MEVTTSNHVSVATVYFRARENRRWEGLSARSSDTISKQGRIPAKPEWAQKAASFSTAYGGRIPAVVFKGTLDTMT